jgi:glyoxylase-like metal-dependent hydrolase (beta-lactamase superfamily II)
VDPPFTRDQIQAVGDWVERSGKRLAYIYASHGHGDHWFGTGELARRFPGLIPERPVLAEPIPAQGLLLEGNEIVAVETGHSDTDKTSVLHVPSIGLVAAGDVAYNGVHQTSPPPALITTS